MIGQKITFTDSVFKYDRKSYGRRQRYSWILNQQHDNKVPVSTRFLMQWFAKRWISDDTRADPANKLYVGEKPTKSAQTARSAHNQNKLNPENLRDFGWERN